MILIRGMRGEAYARKIEKGIVDCRDILSALLVPPKTGYAFSDYYEKNLAKALSYLSPLKSTDMQKQHHPPDGAVFVFGVCHSFAACSSSAFASSSRPRTR